MAQVVLDLGARFRSRVNLAVFNSVPNSPGAPPLPAVRNETNHPAAKHPKPEALSRLMLWIDDPKCINSSAPAAEQGGLPDFTGKYHFLFFNEGENHGSNSESVPPRRGWGIQANEGPMF